MARKNYPFNRRDEKKMNKLFSGLLAGLIAPIFSGASLDDLGKMTRKEESVYVLLLAIIATPFILYWILDLFGSGETLLGCIITILFILIWGCAFMANRTSYKDK